MTYLARTAALATLLMGTSALAGPVDDIVSQFKGYGYESIEISQNGNTIRIEGQRGGTQREITYDLSSSSIVKDETSTSGEDGGAEVKERTRTRAANGVEDDETDDHGDDDRDDDHGDDHGNDDQDDDHGSDDNGNDDHGDDDHGDDDSGDDDSGDDDSGDDDSGDDENDD